MQVWRELAVPYRGMLKGAWGHPQNPQKFFQRTFITEGVKALGQVFVFTCFLLYQACGDSTQTATTKYQLTFGNLQNKQIGELFDVEIEMSAERCQANEGKWRTKLELSLHDGNNKTSYLKGDIDDYGYSDDEDSSFSNINRKCQSDTIVFGKIYSVNECQNNCWLQAEFVTKRCFDYSDDCYYYDTGAGQFIEKPGKVITYETVARVPLSVQANPWELQVKKIAETDIHLTLNKDGNPVNNKTAMIVTTIEDASEHGVKTGRKNYEHIDPDLYSQYHKSSGIEGWLCGFIYQKDLRRFASYNLSPPRPESRNYCVIDKRDITFDENGQWHGQANKFITNVCGAQVKLLIDGFYLEEELSC